MRKIIAIATMTTALTVPLAGTATADTGGMPNENAFTQTGNADPQGRKGGSCPVPGSVFKLTAKADGSNHTDGTPNGYWVKTCIQAGR
jgi:hypothetical protein